MEKLPDGKAVRLLKQIWENNWQGDRALDGGVSPGGSWHTHIDGIQMQHDSFLSVL